MIEKGKISSLQMAFMIFPVVVATGDLLLPAVISKHAERDAWISPFIASLIGYVTIYILYRLHQLYPRKTIIEYAELIVGRVGGKLVGFLLLFYSLMNNGTIIRQYTEFINGVFLPFTPMIFIMGSMALACAFAIRGGVEVLARLSQMFVPIVILFWVLIFILSTPDMEPKNLLPVMERGMIPPLTGAIAPMGWFGHVMLITFLLPYVTDREKGMKWGMISVFCIFLTLFLLNLGTLMVFGGITSSLTFPIMSFARYISIADFLEHLESIVMAIWVISAFMKISLYLFAINLGISQWLHLSDYRPTVLPITFLQVWFGIWVSPNLPQLAHFVGTIMPFSSLTMEVFVPLLLLFIALIRKVMLKKQEA